MESLKNIEMQMTNYYQLITVDSRGFVVSSDDTIFPASKFSNTSIFEEVPIFFGFENVLSALQEPLLIPRVQKPHNLLTGFYDFVFYRDINDSNFFNWEIFDYTHLYDKILEIQQSANEQAIAGQYGNVNHP